MDSLPEETKVVFTFWNGMELQTQIYMLEICSSCKSLDSLVFFRHQDWRRPADILDQLEEFRSFYMETTSYNQGIHARILRTKNCLGFLS